MSWIVRLGCNDTKYMVSGPLGRVNPIATVALIPARAGWVPATSPVTADRCRATRPEIVLYIWMRQTYIMLA